LSKNFEFGINNDSRFIPVFGETNVNVLVDKFESEYNKRPFSIDYMLDSLFYAYAGSYSETGQRISLKHDYYFRNNSKISDKDLQALRDNLIKIQRPSLRAYIKALLILKTRIDSKNTESLNNRVYGDMYLADAIVSRQDIDNLALAYEEAIHYRAFSNLNLKIKGSINVIFENAKGIEFTAQRKYQELGVQMFRIKLKRIIARKDAYVLSDLLNALIGELKEYKIPIHSRLPSNAFVAQYTNGINIMNPVNEFYFRLERKDREVLQEEFIESIYPKLIIEISNELQRWRGEGIKAEEDLWNLIAGLIDILVIDAGVSVNKFSMLDDISGIKSNSNTLPSKSSALDSIDNSKKIAPCVSLTIAPNLANSIDLENRILIASSNPVYLFVSPISINQTLRRKFNPNVFDSDWLKNEGEDRELIALKCPPKVIKEFEEYRSSFNGNTASKPTPDNTILGWGLDRRVFVKTSIDVKGAQVFKAKGNLGNYIKKGYYYHLDTLHKGTSGSGRPHIEFYNSKGIHQGTLSLDGKKILDGAIKGRTIKLN
jgi:hypothetical protein